MAPRREPGSPPAKTAQQPKKPRAPRELKPVEPPMTNMRAVEQLVASLARETVVDTRFLALAQLGRTLARLLDDAEMWGFQTPDGKPIALAPVAKEFRAVVDALVAGVNRDDDDDTFGSDLPAQVRHRKES